MTPEWIQSIALSLALVAVLVVGVRLQARKTRERLAVMGERLGLRLTESGLKRRAESLGDFDRAFRGVAIPTADRVAAARAKERY